MVELLISYFDFLTWSLSFWWTTLTEPKSWYWYPPLIFACIFYFGLILALSGWAVSLALALISIPIYGLQKLTGFKIPLIGAYIDKAWAQSAKNVDQDALRSIENEQIKTAIIFNNKKLSNEELRCVHKILELMMVYNYSPKLPRLRQTCPKKTVSILKSSLQTVI